MGIKLITPDAELAEKYPARFVLQKAKADPLTAPVQADRPKRPPKEYRDAGTAGPAEYADPDNFQHSLHKPAAVKAAIRYFSNSKNAVKYPTDVQAAIWVRIKAAAKKFGIEVSGPGEPPSVEKGKSMGKSMTGLERINQYLELSKAQGGPYIGPKGGKWADPQHKVAWKELGKTSSGKSVHEAGHEDYQGVKKVKDGEHKFTSSPLYHHQALRQNFPQHTKQDHADAAKIHKEHAQSTAAEHTKIAHQAEQKWGTEPKYYPQEVQDKLKGLHEQSTKSSMAAEQHEKAGKAMKRNPAQPKAEAEPFEQPDTGSVRDVLPESYHRARAENDARTAVAWNTKPEPGESEEKPKTPGLDALKEKVEAEKKPEAPQAKPEPAPTPVPEKKPEPKADKKGQLSLFGGGGNVKKSLDGLAGLGEFLAKADPAAGLPTGEPTLGGSGAEQGGEVAGKGKVSGDPSSGPSKGFDKDGKALGTPAVKTEKLSEDDEDVESQLKAGTPKTLGKSMAAPAHQREMVARENAAAVSQLLKGDPDIRPVLGPSAPQAAPEALQKADAWTQGKDARVLYSNGADRAVDQLLKADPFYTFHAPTITRDTLLIHQVKACGACKSTFAKSLSACPHCGTGSLDPTIALHGHEPVAELEKSMAPRLRPRREADLYFPNRVSSPKE